MTTIACDGHTIAGDGMMVSNQTVIALSYEKVGRTNRGEVYGFAGRPETCEDFAIWLAGERERDFYTNSDFSALILTPDGTLHVSEGNYIRA